jgi:PPOX class probable F420-dependent enzyme
MPKADHLSASAVALLQEPQLAHFVTLMPDGSPQVTPVWVDVEHDGSYILINTAEGRLKTKNIDQDNRVAVSVVDATNPWRFVLVRGDVVERRQEGAREHIDFLAKKYTGADKYTFSPPGEQRVIIRIKPHHVVDQSGSGS